MSTTPTPMPAEGGPVVAFPTGHKIQFPVGLSGDDLHQAAATIWNQIKSAGSTLSEEVGGGAMSLAHTPEAVYHALADPSTIEDIPYGADPLHRAVGRMFVKPVVNAAEDYSSKRWTPESMLSAAPEAIGAAGAQVLAGKAIGDYLGGEPEPAAGKAPEPTPKITEADVPKSAAERIALNKRVAKYIADTDKTRAGIKGDAILDRLKENAANIAKSAEKGAVDDDLTQQLQESLEIAKSRKAVPNSSSESGVKAHNEAYSRAKAELGKDASFSDVLKRAQSILEREANKHWAERNPEDELDEATRRPAGGITKTPQEVLQKTIDAVNHLRTRVDQGDYNSVSALRDAEEQLAALRKK